MAFSSIASSDIEIGRPADNELWQKVKDSLDYIYSNVTNRESGNALSNGSFESASSNVPDGWEINLYPGGASTYQDGTSEVIHGQGALTIVHPGGAGNGGGYITSEYFPCTTGTNSQVIVQNSIRVNATSMGFAAQVQWYDRNKTLLSETTYSTQSTWVSGRVNRISGICVPPSSARFAKVNFCCGTTDISDACRITIDNVSVDNMGIVRDIMTYDPSTVAETGTVGTTGYVTCSTFYLNLPRSNTTYVAKVSFRHKFYVGFDDNGVGRFRKGTTYVYQSTLSQGSSDRLVEAVFLTTGGRVAVNAEYAQTTTGSTFTATKTHPVSNCKFEMPLST